MFPHRIKVRKISVRGEIKPWLVLINNFRLALRLGFLLVEKIT